MMNRRKALGGLLIGAGTITGFAGYKWYDWHKKPDLHFLSTQGTVLDAICQTIIPATDSPGAGDAGTGQYIIAMIRDCTDLKGQNRFIDGLKELADFSKVHYNRAYPDCTPAEQKSVLTIFEKQGRPLPGIMGKAQERFIGKSFFTILREYTVKGYCTSKKGATMGLAYVPVPGGYRGVVPILPGQKSWATK